MQITLSYTHGGITYSRNFELLAIEGMDEPDRLRKNAIVHDDLDGSLDERVNGFFKEPIVLTFKPPFAPTDTRFLAHWFIAAAKRVTYGPLTSEGITDDELISQWLYDCEHNRVFEVSLYDEQIYYEWTDGTPAIADELMYFLNAVEFTGTEASPEEFTTNVGKLLVMENEESWPAFDAETHVFTVDINGSKYCQATFGIVMDSISVSAGKITFQAFVSDYGAAASDGKYYADVKISLMEIPE